VSPPAPQSKISAHTPRHSEVALDPLGSFQGVSIHRSPDSRQSSIMNHQSQGPDGHKMNAAQEPLSATSSGPIVGPLLCALVAEAGVKPTRFTKSRGSGGIYDLPHLVAPLSRAA